MEVTFSIMPLSSKYTRYFIFSRVNPSERDYRHLCTECKRINAYFGYRTMRDGDRIRLIGFIVLRGHRTVASDLVRGFPNFSLTGSHYDENFNKDVYDVVVGEHPFGALKVDLFG